MIRKISWLLAGMILLSTMFLKQHSAVDVICGSLLYTMVYWAIYVKRAAQPVRNR